MSRQSFAGFTLLEVMVALAVLALALGAVIKTAGTSANQLGELRSQTLAGWVALNKTHEFMLARDWPALGASRGNQDMAGQEWRWEAQVSETSDQDLRRLDITVRLSGASPPLVKLSAFKRRPQKL